MKKMNLLMIVLMCLTCLAPPVVADGSQDKDDMFSQFKERVFGGDKPDRGDRSIEDDENGMKDLEKSSLSQTKKLDVAEDYKEEKQKLKDKYSGEKYEERLKEVKNEHVKKLQKIDKSSGEKDLEQMSNNLGGNYVTSVPDNDSDENEKNDENIKNEKPNTEKPKSNFKEVEDIKNKQWFKELEKNRERKFNKQNPQDLDESGDDKKEIDNEMDGQRKKGIPDKVKIDTKKLEEDISKSEKEKKIPDKLMYIKVNDDFTFEDKDVKIKNKLQDGYVVKIPVTKISEYVENENVDKIVDRHSINKVREQQKEQIKQEYEKRNLNREKLEVKPSEMQEAKERGEEKLQELNYSTENPYKYYFLNLSAVPQTSSVNDAYQQASDIIYITDMQLFDQQENWLTVNEVYSMTPQMDTNPFDEPVSDCEEHAMVFVALARQNGVEPENIRVVTGYIQMDGEEYGHAWVQYKQDGTWMDIEPTSGSYYENGELVESQPLPMDYYEDKAYPVVEYWSMFNDKYYKDDTGGNAPDSWQINTTTSYTVSKAMNKDVFDYFTSIYDWVDKSLYRYLN